MSTNAKINGVESEALVDTHTNRQISDYKEQNTRKMCMQTELHNTARGMSVGWERRLCVWQNKGVLREYSVKAVMTSINCTLQALFPIYL